MKNGDVSRSPPPWVKELTTSNEGIAPVSCLLEANARRRMRLLLRLKPRHADLQSVQEYARIARDFGVFAREDLRSAGTIVLDPVVACLVELLVSRQPLPTGVRGASLLRRLSEELRGQMHEAPSRWERARQKVWRGVPLQLEDHNPISLFQDHPDQPAGRKFGLGGASQEAWLDGLRSGFALVERYLPVLADELAMLARCVLPVGTDDEVHFSASYSHMPGCAYVSLHPDPLTMAEALVHEFQHNKLLALMRLSPLWTNPPNERHKSPLRPDPRPFRGIVLAAHAFIPVAQLHEAMAAEGDPLSTTRRFARRREEVRAKNKDAMAILGEHGRWTPWGGALWRGMARDWVDVKSGF